MNPLVPQCVLSHQVVMPAQSRKVMVTITVPNPNPNRASTSSGLLRELKVALDTSGSTSDPSGPNNRKSKLTSMKDASIRLVDGVPGDIFVSVESFASQHARVMTTQTAASSRAEAKKLIQKLTSGGQTGITSALRQAALSKKPGYLTRALIETDGLFNLDSESKLMSMMKDPLCVPIWFVGIGADYNDQLLTELADAAPEGSVFIHVSDADELFDVTQDLLATMNSLGGYTNVKIKLTALNGVVPEYANKFVPGYHEVPIEPLGQWQVTSFDDSLDPNGQQLLVGLDMDSAALHAKFGGQGDIVVDVAKYEITYDEAGITATPIVGTLQVTITDNAANFNAAPVNQTVLNTMFTRMAHIATLNQNYGAAATLLTRAGNTSAAVVLQTMSTENASPLQVREAQNATRFAGREVLKTISS